MSDFLFFIMLWKCCYYIFIHINIDYARCNWVFVINIRQFKMIYMQNNFLNILVWPLSHCHALVKFFVICCQYGVILTFLALLFSFFRLSSWAKKSTTLFLQHDKVDKAWFETTTPQHNMQIFILLLFIINAVELYY